MKLLTRAAFSLVVILSACATSPKAPGINEVSSFIEDGKRHVIIFAENEPNFDYIVLYIISNPEDIKEAEALNYSKMDNEQVFMDKFGSIIVEDSSREKGMAIFSMPNYINKIGILVRAMKTENQYMRFYWKYLEVELNSDEAKQYYRVSISKNIEKISKAEKDLELQKVNRYSIQKTFLGNKSKKIQVGYIKL